MSTVETTGYLRDNQGVFIPKDPQAQLVYVFDWEYWLSQGDSITQVDYALQVRSNDPQPLLRLNQGIQQGQKTFVELSGGAVGKIYTVTADVLTANGSRDRRNFRVKIENRSA